MKNVVFVCVQNACRSQIAEAFVKKYLPHYACYSAGTNPAKRINAAAVRIMKDVYQINMEPEQYPKSLSQLPHKIDVLVTMGCGVNCPYVPCTQKIEWNIEDPVGKDDQYFINVIKKIRIKVRCLAAII